MATPMTVAELIDALRAFPADTPVLYVAYSDYSPLEPDEIRFYPKEGRTIYPANPRRAGIICRNGHWMLAEDGWKERGDEPYLDVIVFPGN